MSRKFDRRLVLKLLGAGAGVLGAGDAPLHQLLRMMTGKQLGTALGQTAAPRRWIDFRFNSAPPRWMYDLFLTPYGRTGFVEANTVGTRLVESGGRYADVEYATVNRAGLQVPWLWASNVPKVGGGVRPMSDLLPNMLQMRGVSAANPGHTGAQMLHFQPIGSLYTISALASDVSSAPIPAIFKTSNYAFGSRTNKSAVLVQGNNLIDSLMTPFLKSGSARALQQRSAMRSYMTAVRNAMAPGLTADNARAVTSIEAQKAAHELFQTNFGDLAAAWTELYGKYRDLIRRAFDPAAVLVGFNDKPIGKTTGRGPEYLFNNIGVQNGDLRTIVDAQSAMDLMAGAFALSEFVVRNNLSDSITLEMGSLTGILINGARVSMVHDEHFTGTMVSFVVNMQMARAHAACLLAFIDFLKATGEFERTIINVNGEFNRRPRPDRSGSDHNWEGANWTFYSGLFPAAKVVGNIGGNPDPNYPGTWGIGAPVAGAGNIQLDLGHVAASIATMLKAQSPVTARSTILSESGNEIVPTIANAEIAG